MSISPRGMSVQEAYRIYREGMLLVNRRYQRKLVWTTAEKKKLIDSVIRGYPVPLILLAERPQGNDAGKYEIVDGMQRFNAIFSFIENAFDLEEKYFDVREFARAKQFADEGLFAEADPTLPRLPPKECANILDYQLAVTIFPTTNEAEITEVFGRINSNGKQLSNQEKRQAGVMSGLAMIVRTLASEIRGDVSAEVLDLRQMPEVSIDSKKSRQNYAVQAEETIWCRQGILTPNQLRDSEDEQIIADICASVLFKKPLEVSQESLDDLYDPSTDEAKSIETSLATYRSEQLAEDLKSVFSVLEEVVTSVSTEQNALLKAVQPAGQYPIKTPFYALFMAFFELIVQEGQAPSDAKGIMKAIGGLAKKLTVTRHYVLAEDRRKNIDLTKGLVQPYFVRREPSVLGHGPGLAKDLENSIRRSKTETSRYEFKQGILRLENDRKADPDLLDRVVETVCGMANCTPGSPSYLHFGVADKESDALRIKSLDGIEPVKVGEHFVVGIDREVTVLKMKLDDYIKRITSHLRASKLSEPLKSQVLSGVDLITYRGLSVVRFSIPPQSAPSYVDQRVFTRVGSSTVEATGLQLLALAQAFAAKSRG